MVLTNGLAFWNPILNHSQDDLFSALHISEYAFGNAGHDSIFGSFDNDYLDGGSGNDFLAGYGGSDILTGGSGNDVVEGGSGNDFLTGDSGHDSVVGGAGYDLLIGGTGHDSLSGGSGSDILIGTDPSFSSPGSGEYDTLTGGTGDDLFVLGDSLGAYYQGLGYATITDFYWSEGDKIQVFGSLHNYSLSASNGATHVFYHNDLIAVISNTTNVIISDDFIVA